MFIRKTSSLYGGIWSDYMRELNVAIVRLTLSPAMTKISKLWQKKERDKYCVFPLFSFVFVLFFIYFFSHKFIAQKIGKNVSSFLSPSYKNSSYILYGYKLSQVIKSASSCRVTISANCLFLVTPMVKSFTHNPWRMCGCFE